MGRPTRFRPQFVRKIGDLLLLGLTNQQIAKTLGISDRSLYSWQKTIPAITSVFAQGRELAQAGVARNLYKRANGFRVKTEKVFQHQGEIIRAKTTEYYPPDVRAAEIILTKRRPDLWPSDKGIQVGVQVVAGLPEDTLSGLQKLARATSGLALPEPNREEGNAS